MSENTDLYSLQPAQIVFYGVGWCPDCRRARAVLKREGTPFLDIDVDQDPRAEAFVKQVNRGFRSVPTIVFPDGRVLVEPGDAQLSAALRGPADHA